MKTVKRQLLNAVDAEHLRSPSSTHSFIYRVDKSLRDFATSSVLSNAFDFNARILSIVRAPYRVTRFGTRSDQYYRIQYTSRFVYSQSL